LNKPVLLLNDRTLPQLQADLAGRLYRTFDPHDPWAVHATVRGPGDHRLRAIMSIVDERRSPGAA
jgi:hypothetical protein